MDVLRSPVFIICLVLFLLHQFLQKILSISLPFPDSYLDNIVAMPIILTLLLAERRWLFKKGSNYQIPVIDTVVATLYIIFISEVFFPLLSQKFTADWKDLLFYALGSFVFYKTINTKRQRTLDNSRKV